MYNGSFGFKILLLLFPGFNYQALIKNFVAYHSKFPEKNYGWNNIDYSNKEGVIKSSKVFLQMFISIIVYEVLAWYISQALDDSQGSKKGVLFIFKPSYWNGKTEVDKVVEGDTPARLLKESGDKHNIIIKKLTKSFKTVRALKEVSETIDYGKCTALLGENGSGKTTLVSILSGQLSLTYGYVFIDGLNISTQTSQVQKLIGVCPQFDRLWDLLTAEEHFKIMCIFHDIQ